MNLGDSRNGSHLWAPITVAIAFWLTRVAGIVRPLF